MSNADLCADMKEQLDLDSGGEVSIISTDRLSLLSLQSGKKNPQTAANTHDVDQAVVLLLLGPALVAFC